MVHAQCVLPILFTVFFGCEMCSRGTFLLLLLFAVNAKVFGEDDREIIKQLHRVASDQMEHMTIMLNMMVSNLQANNKMSQQFSKMEARFETQENTLRGMSQKVDAMFSSVQDNKNQIKNLVECQKWLMKFNQTNFFNTEGKNFYFHNEKLLTWNATHDWCADKKMQMPTIKVPSAMQQMVKELNTLGFDSHGVWLAASDIGRKSGEFFWTDGTAVDNSTWMKGQPNKFGAGVEACVYIHSGSAIVALADWKCSGLSYTLCEVQADSHLNSCF